MHPSSLTCIAFFAALLPSVVLGGTPGRTHRTFLANEGQWDPAILYRGASATANVSFLRDGISFSMVEPENEEHEEAGVDHHAEPEFIVWNMLLVGASDKMRVHGEDGRPSVTNFLSGNDPRRWVRHPLEVRQVVYEEVYAGIDLHFHHTGDDLKYDYVVHSGGDVGRIRNTYAGIDGLTMNASGDLLITTALGTQVQRAPASWQVVDGVKHPVPMDFVLHNDSTFGFAVRGAFDRAHELIIDPLFEMVWASYTRAVGSGNNINYAYANAMDAQGNVYMTGMVDGTFPITPGAYSGPGNVYPEVFVAKFSANGTTLLYSTYLPGRSSEVGTSIAVDALGRAYVTGSVALNITGITNFPSTSNAYQPVHAAGTDAFLTVLDPTGSSLVYSTFLGGTGSENGYALALGPTGIAYISGTTSTGDLQEVAATNYPGGDGELFVAKFDIAQIGTASLIYLVRIGAGSFNYCSNHGIDVDALGNAYVTGNVLVGFGSSSFPVTAGAFNTSYNNTMDAGCVYLLKLGNTLPVSIAYSTFLGPGQGASVAVLGDEAYVVGTTATPTFPITSGAHQSTYGGSNSDAFALKMNATGSDLIYSTYLGGDGQDQGTDIVLNGAGEAFVTGISRGGFPTSAGGFQPEHAGLFTNDIFLVQLNASGSDYGCGGSTYVGGTQDEYFGSFSDYFAPSIALLNVGGQDYVSVAATSHSEDFPTTPGVYETTKVNSIADQPVFFKMSCANSALAPVAGLNAISSSTCTGAVFDFEDASSNGANSWTWSFPGGNPTTSIEQDPQDIVYAAPGTYTVTLESCNPVGCDEVVEEITVIAQPLPTITLGNDTALCDTDALTLSADPDLASYAWQLNGTPLPDTTPTISVDAPGTYTLQATDAAACVAVDTIVVDQLTTPVAVFDFEQIDSPCGVDHVRFHAASSAASQSWDFGDGSAGSGPVQEHHYANAGTYSVQYTVTDGPCSAAASQTVVVNSSTGPTPTAAMVPNVFSPNGDGVNDCFAPSGLEANPECFTVQVFDRWGLSVFTSGGSNACWKGVTDAGDPVPDGVYYYFVRIGDLEQQGSVQVLR